MTRGKHSTSAAAKVAGELALARDAERAAKAEARALRVELEARDRELARFRAERADARQAELVRGTWTDQEVAVMTHELEEDYIGRLRSAYLYLRSVGGLTPGVIDIANLQILLGIPLRDLLAREGSPRRVRRATESRLNKARALRDRAGSGPGSWG